MCPAQAFTSDKMVLVWLHSITLPWLYRRIANENRLCLKETTTRYCRNSKQYNWQSFPVVSNCSLIKWAQGFSHHTQPAFPRGWLRDTKAQERSGHVLWLERWCKHTHSNTWHRSIIKVIWNMQLGPNPTAVISLASSPGNPVELDPLHQIPKPYPTDTQMNSVGVENSHCVFCLSAILPPSTALNAGSGPQPINITVALTKCSLYLGCKF